MIFTGYWKVLILTFSEMGIRSFLEPKSWRKYDIYWLLERILLLNIYLFLFWTFGDRKYSLFWVKKLMERWYLLVTEKFLFWNFRWWEIQSFFQKKKLMKRLYLHRLFELSMIFQDLGNMVFRAVYNLFTKTKNNNSHTPGNPKYNQSISF